MRRLCCLLSLVFLPVLWAEESGTTISESSVAEPKQETVELVLNSVTLHAAGKGWFEYSGSVEGAGKFSVDVGAFEVDEAIRVSRLVDPAGGGKIRLAAGRDPIRPDAVVPNTRTLGDLLVSMKGQSIVATMRDGQVVRGRLVAIEQRTDSIGETSEDREYMTLLTDGGLRTSLVEDAVSIDSTDEAFNRRLAATLSDLARTSELPASTIEFVFAKGERRHVTVGVMRRVPMWKNSYRIEGGQLIHRSVVDNTSGSDWSGVDLHLIDGSPVLFAMDMHSVARARLDAVQRPTNHVSLAPSFQESRSRTLSTPDVEEITSADRASGNDGDLFSEMKGMNAGMMGMGGMGGGMGGMGGGMGDGFGGMGGAPDPNDSSSSSDLDPTASMNQVLAETQDAPAGSTLSLRFDDVELASDATALLDTLVAPISIDEVSVFRESYHRTATLLCLEIENNTASLLPSGPLSVLAGEGQRSILGELVFPALGPNTKRLMGFAIDGGVRVTVEPMIATSEVKSIALQPELHQIHIETLYENKTDYEFLNRSGEDRVMILEVPSPRPPFEWVDETETKEASKEASKLVKESAEKFDRVRFSLDDGQTQTQTIVHQHTETVIREYATIATSQLEAWIADPKWDDSLTERLKTILQSRQELDETNETLAALLAMRNQVIQEISRVSNQLTRERNGLSFPREILTRYQARVLELENQRAKSEQRMRTLETTRRKWTAELGMDPRLPGNLTPLRAFIVDTDLIPADMPDPIQVDADSKPGERPADNDPFGGVSRSDPFGK